MRLATALNEEERQQQLLAMVQPLCRTVAEVRVVVVVVVGNQSSPNAGPPCHRTCHSAK